MGQRLVITIKDKNKELAALHYHWSAYTLPALQETQQLIHFLDSHKFANKKDMLLALVRYAESNGGGIRGCDSEREYIQNMFPGEEFRKSGYSRNNGLIALSKSGIDDFQSWGEGDVIVDISSRNVEFYVVFGYIDKKDFKSATELPEDEINKIMKCDFNLDEFSFDDIDTIIQKLDCGTSYIVGNDDLYYEFIE